MSNPMDALRKLGEAIDEMADELGIEMCQFIIQPGRNGTKDMAQCAFVVLEPEDDDEPDTAFDDIIANMTVVERDAPVEE